MNETRRKILESAITLWATNSQATLEQIATDIGISRRTLHRHYDGREDLIVSVLNYLVSEYLQTIDKTLLKAAESPLAKLKALFFNDIANATHYVVYKNLSQIMVLDNEEMKMSQQKLHNIYHAVFLSLIDSAEVSSKVTAKWLELFYAAVIEAVIKGIQEGKELDLANLAWSTFWAGIKK